MKSLTTISIDSEVILEARRKKINVSKTCNDYLKEYLSISSGMEGEEDKETLRQKILMTRARLKEMEEEYKVEAESVIVKGVKYILKNGEYVKAK